MNLALGSIQGVPVQLEGCRGQLNFVVINTDGIDVMLGREGLLQISQAMEQDEVADQEEEVILTEDVENVTVMEVRLEDNQAKPESCSSWTWTDEDTRMEEPCEDEDMMKAELEVNQVEPRAYSLAAWMGEDTHMGEPHEDKDSMEAELEGDQVEPGSCSLSTWMDEVTHMEEPHDDEVSIGTCVSSGHLIDGSGAERGKDSLPMLEDILPWMCMIEPCMKKQGLTAVAGLVGVTCDLMVRGTRARDKGGT